MYYYVFMAISFLLLASFLNVVIYRLPRGESLLYPSSHCPACGHNLRVLDLLPLLSFIFLRGKCRYCQKRIPVQYPLVEFITPILWMLVFMKWEFTVQTLSGVVFTAILVAAAFTDINHGIIPDTLSLTGLILGLVLSFGSTGILQSILGALAFGLIFLLAALLSHGGMGGGDIKLAAVIGAFTGVKGAIMVFIISSLLGGLWVLPLLIRGKAGLRTPIKFAPFLAVAAWLIWMYQMEIMSFYWNML
ncbi:MAG: prepilin peptidase [Syntrophomonas sp.]|nr:prepilin peptidase [Syntrophomonas sp.]